MKAVVDTNVLGYFLLGINAFAAESRRFIETVDELTAPALWEAEMANVIWMAIRHGILPAEEGPKRLALAGYLKVHSVPIQSLWQGALRRSLDSKVAMYDTLFVELASRERIPLATFDGGILKAFPEIAKRPRSFVTE